MAPRPTAWWTAGVDVAALFLELYGRIPPLAKEAVDGLDPELLVTAPEPGANTIAWLLWHQSRVADHIVADVSGQEQVWVTGEWAGHFGLAPGALDTGYGHTAEQVLSVRPSGPSPVLGYLHAVDRQARAFVESLGTDELDRVVDRSYDPPVTLGVRLVSVADDGLQHVGQAAYVRGLLERRS
jgi:hypothetical protein